ncbi:methionyl-tRNA formyltransferase [Corynebacterium urogenitale]
MKIIFAGTPEPAAVSLEYLLADDRLEVVAVVTQPDAKRGRGRTLHPSKVAEVAQQHGIPTYKWPTLARDSESGEEARQILSDLAHTGVTAAAVVAYGNLIPADLLDVFDHGWINLHFSVLPRWRGAAPVQAAIAAGDEVTGASTFRIEKGLDTGPVIATSEEPIGLEDTADALLTRLTYSGRVLLADSLVSLSDATAQPTPQPVEGVTHAAKIRSADAQIQWNDPARVIQRVARAHTPAPGAWTMLGDKRYKIGMMLPHAGSEQLAAGQLALSGNAVIVGTGEGSLEITRIQPPGKKMMAAQDWARGQQELWNSDPYFLSPHNDEQGV